MDWPQLQRSFSEVIGRSPGAIAEVAISSAGSSFVTRSPQPSPPLTRNISCIAKLLTAQLALDALSSKGIAWDTPVLDVIPVQAPRLNAALRGVSFRHLLNHTHGLTHGSDRSRPGAGMMDAASLADMAGGFRDFEPGQYYSYSDAGAYLLGYALERLLNTSYAQQLLSWARDDSGITPGWMAVEAHACIDPSIGGVLRASAEDLAALLPRLLQGLQRLSIGSKTHPDYFDVEDIAATPGWSPYLRGCAFGWKIFGEGWIGHNAYARDGGALAWINPRLDLTIAVVAEGIIPIHLAARLLPEIVSAISPTNRPRLLTPSEMSQVDTTSLLGLYRSGRHQLRIARSADELMADIIVCDGASDPVSGLTLKLRPATQRAYFSSPTEPVLVPYIQELGNSGSGPTRHLWNGRAVWTRVEGNDRQCDA